MEMIRRPASFRWLLTVATAVLAVAFGADLSTAAVRINELLASNRLAAADSDGDFSDWLEIVNADDVEISLDRYSLTDDPDVGGKWIFPDVRLGPGEYLIVWCSGKDRRGPELHASFELSRRGEVVQLRDGSGVLVDALTFPAQTEDHSWGRFPDSSGAPRFLLEPTPGGPNDTIASADPIDARPAISPAAGRYDREVTVTLSGRFPAGVTIRFTTSGAPPDSGSPAYEGPLSVSGRTVVRAAGFVNGRRVTQVATQSYFVGVLDLDLPFLSIAMRPEDFVLVHTSNQGHGRDFERPAHLELFDAQGQPVVATGMGLRLHGGVGRHGGLEMKKSYRTYFRRIYGAGKLRSRLFPDTGVDRFDQLVLRANYVDLLRRDRRGTLIRDQVVRNLHRDMGAIVSHGTWYNVFVNGEYRGLYNVVERIDKSFLESHVDGTGESDWDVIQPRGEVLDGNREAWEGFMEFVEQSDLASPGEYAGALQRLDIVNFTDYLILNFWAENIDWPMQNWFAVRPRSAGARWRFVAWDAEATFAYDRSENDPDTLNYFLVNGGGSEVVTIFLALVRNEEYRALFLERLDTLLATVLSPANVVGRIREQIEAVEPDVPEEAGITGGDPVAWRTAVDGMLRFPEFRDDEVREFITSSTLFDVPPGSPFRRGDPNDDGGANISDAIFVLEFLFLGGPGSACLDALDMDDSGGVSITDAVFFLNFLFRGAVKAPPPPFEACGVDPTGDALGCQARAACGAAGK